jgi:hypothetical protein
VDSEQITKWAREVLLTCRDGSCAYVSGADIRPALQAFANLVRQHTLEEAAKVCDGEADNWFASVSGQDACKDCANEIRSLKT